jgi:hypothetical protein
VESKLAHLRPTTIPEMLDRLFHVFLARPLVFLSLSGLYAVSELFAGLVAQRALQPGAGSTLLLIEVLLRLIGEWCCAGAALAAFQVTLFPARPLTLHVTLMAALPRFPQFLLTRFVLVAIVIGLGYIVPLRLLEAQQPDNVSYLHATLAVVSVFAAIYAAAHWYLASLLIMVEGRYFLRAAVRSNELMRLRFRKWDSALIRLLVCLTLPAAILVSVVLPFEGVAWYLSGKLAAPGAPIGPYAGAWLPVQSLIILLCSPLMWICSALIYCECRMRDEGLDFQVHLLERGAVPSEIGGDEIPLPIQP